MARRRRFKVGDTVNVVSLDEPFRAARLTIEAIDGTVLKFTEPVPDWVKPGNFVAATSDDYRRVLATKPRSSASAGG